MSVKSKIFYWYAAFVIAFTLVLLLPAPDSATLVRYHISALGLRLLDATFIIPEALIWFAAFYGYAKLHSYSQLIQTGKDGKQIARLATGLLLLAVGLPVGAILGGILSIIAAHEPSFKNPSVIISNYLGVLFPLLAFLWIGRGARGLSNLIKGRPQFWKTNVTTVAVITLGVIFCCLIVLDHAELRKAYHMSPELVMLTLGIPYMYTWFLGFFASVELQTYSQRVTGVVYRRGWNTLILGFVSIILLSILIQYLSTLTTWLTSLSLGWALLLLYALLFLLAGAYIVVALGATRLTKIEEA
jgi:hypothetical protein